MSLLTGKEMKDDLDIEEELKDAAEMIEDICRNTGFFLVSNSNEIWLNHVSRHENGDYHCQGVQIEPTD